MNYEYKTIQFTAQLKGGILSTKGASIDSQLLSIINQHIGNGWEYYSMEVVHIYVKTGCLASIFGRKDEVLYQDVLVFRKQS
ncbi:MAG: hypothetical protein Q8N03_04435 [Ignavibacteria bacterium]|nr:hypothetical protein [Ignavibacteria bacterium]